MLRPPTSALLAAFIASAALAFAACGKEPKPSRPAGGDSDYLPDFSMPSQPALQYPPPPPLPARSDDPAVGAIDDFIAKSGIDRTAAGWKTTLPMPPRAQFKAGNVYSWNLETNKGPIRIMLLPDIAPMHVSNAIYLTRLGFYDGLTFHRVIQGFMAQGGDPLGNGQGTPGYGLALEKDPKYLHNRRGIVSAAHSQIPNSDGSQFFLMFGPYRSLDGRTPADQYTIYGTITDGEATLKALEAAGAPSRPGAPDAPRERLVIERATITVQ